MFLGQLLAQFILPCPATTVHYALLLSVGLLFVFLTVRRHWLQAKNKMLMRAATVVKSCRTCFKFYCMFYFTCDRSLRLAPISGLIGGSERTFRYSFN